MTDSQAHIKSLNEKIQGLKNLYYKDELTLDALCHAVAIAGINEVEAIYKESKKQNIQGSNNL